MSCVVCGHVRRREIEAAAGEPSAELLEVAIRFGVSLSRLRRHATMHSRADTTAASPAAPLADAPRPRRVPRRAPTSDVAPATVLHPEPSPASDDEAPATSRSPDVISTRPRTARERVERFIDSLQAVVDEVQSHPDASLPQRMEALRTMTGPLRLLGTFTGELGASETRVASSPFYTRVRKAVLEALKKHPDAARDVVTALERIERGTDAEEITAESTAA